MEGGNRIAFDPRDLDTEGESKKMPKLTLMEEVLLLGLNDKQVGVIGWYLPWAPLIARNAYSRDTSHSGTITSRILYGAV
jgi:hypothetical protein